MGQEDDKHNSNKQLIRVLYILSALHIFDVLRHLTDSAFKWMDIKISVLI